jgi:hypothetical protein
MVLQSVLEHAALDPGLQAQYTDQIDGSQVLVGPARARFPQEQKYSNVSCSLWLSKSPVATQDPSGPLSRIRRSLPSCTFLSTAMRSLKCCGVMCGGGAVGSLHFFSSAVVLRAQQHTSARSLKDCQTARIKLHSCQSAVRNAPIA